MATRATRRTSVVAFAAAAIIGLLVRPVAAADGGTPAGPCKLTATVAASATTILPGEPLDLTLRLKNTSGGDISLEMPSETRGSVRLGIARNVEPLTFRGYMGPRWGIEDSVQTPRPLLRNAAIELPLRVMYQVQRDQPFAFATAGTYKLKVKYQDGSVCPEGTSPPIFTLEVSEPTGSDLTVWNAIKECKRCAHFLHTGRAGKNQAEQDAVALLRKLAGNYPKSRYAPIITKQLDALDDKARGDSKHAKPHDDD
jgi:hypothetical protein